MGYVILLVVIFGFFMFVGWCNEEDMDDYRYPGSFEEAKNAKLTEFTDGLEQYLGHPTKKSVSEACNYIKEYPKSFFMFVTELWGPGGPTRKKISITDQDLQGIVQSYSSVILRAFSEALKEYRLDDCREYYHFIELFKIADDETICRFSHELSVAETIRQFYDTEGGFLRAVIDPGVTLKDNDLLRELLNQLTDGKLQLTNPAGLVFAIKDLYKKRYDEQRIPVDLVCAVLFVRTVYGDDVLALMQIDADRIDAEFNSYATAYQRKIVEEFLQACNHYTERFAQ